MFPPLPPRMEFNSISGLTEKSRKNLQKDATDIITDSPETLKIHISMAFIREVKDEEEEQRRIHNFRLLFLFWVQFYPNTLALKLSDIIQSTAETPLTRTLAVNLMFNLLSYCNSPIRVLFPEALGQIRQNLLHSLQQDFSTPTFPLLSTIVSVVASNVFRLKDEDGSWTEYLDYVASVLDHGDHLKNGLWLILDMPLNITRPRLMPYVDRFQRIVLTQLDSHEDDDIWVLAFGSCFTLMLILRSLEDDIFDNLCSRLKISVTELVDKEKHVFVQKGLQVLSVFVCKEIWRFSKPMLKFLYDMLTYIYHIDSITQETQMEAGRIVEIIRQGVYMMRNVKIE